MRLYQVHWGGESAVVYAANPNDAWGQFCQGHQLAAQHPKLYERRVSEVTDEPYRVLLVEAAEPVGVVEVVEPVVEEVAEESQEDSL